jgi:hypothetical protein
VSVDGHRRGRLAVSEHDGRQLAGPAEMGDLLAEDLAAGGCERWACGGHLALDLWLWPPGAGVRGLMFGW